MRPLNSLLWGVLHRLGLADAIRDYEVVANFDDIFPALKEHAKAIKVEDGILFLKVRESTWRNELILEKNKMITKIESFFRDKRVREIHFV